MLLVALAVFFGACYILYLRTLQSKLVLFGEKSPAQMASPPPPGLSDLTECKPTNIWDSSRPPPRCTLESLNLVLEGIRPTRCSPPAPLPKPRETPKPLAPLSLVNDLIQFLPNPDGKHQLQVPTLDTRWQPYAGLDPCSYLSFHPELCKSGGPRLSPGPLGRKVSGTTH